jgi:hypothetical protein
MRLFCPAAPCFRVESSAELLTVFLATGNSLRMRVLLQQTLQLAGNVVDAALDVDILCRIELAPCARGFTEPIDIRRHRLHLQFGRITEIEQGRAGCPLADLLARRGLLNDPAIDGADEQRSSRETIPAGKGIYSGQRQRRNGQISRYVADIVRQLDGKHQQRIAGFDQVDRSRNGHGFVVLKQTPMCAARGSRTLARTCSRLPARTANSGKSGTDAV